MWRKLYALLILIGAIGALILAYLYFFVYYTATLTIDANVSEYRVELFSLATAQKQSHNCSEKICIIPNVSPFDYNISIIKADYQTKVISAKIGARWKESIVVQLEKKVSLISVIEDKIEETNKQKILRLREEKLYYTQFQVSDDVKLSFTQENDQILLQYKTSENIREIGSFKLIEKNKILVDTISGTKNIFISLGQEYYILDTQKFSLTQLPFELEINYIKSWVSLWKYLVVTPQGTFLYNISDNTSEYQYLFKDFLYSWEDIIGIIYDDEDQKKSNFNLDQSGNLIIKYSPQDKTRKIIETTNLNITRLEWRWDKIIFSVGNSEYELRNFN